MDNIIMDKNCFNPDALMRIFRLLLKMIIMFMKLLKKPKNKSVLLISSKECERYDK